MKNRYAVIMAGGSGTRLWPMSRSKFPKQLLKITPEGKSLLRATVERLLGMFSYDEIYIIAAEHHIKPIMQDIPELPTENLIGEPIGRDTANAVGLSAAVLAERDANATMGIFTADHLIEPKDKFQNALRRAYESVERQPEYLATFGVKPAFAHTGLGYIHRGEKMADAIYRVHEFKEKPNLRKAEEYLSCGEYYWNSGMFVWKVSTILDELKRHLPENTNKLIELGKRYSKSRWAEYAGEIYPALTKISIDFAVMEKAEKVLVVELGANWSDVGSWPELDKVTGLDKNGNAVLAEMVSLTSSKNNVIATSDTEHLIALIGVEDMIVIHTPDATLVCPKSHAQKIKEMVGTINKKYA